MILMHIFGVIYFLRWFLSFVFWTFKHFELFQKNINAIMKKEIFLEEFLNS